ncbi:MAG: hypothetical protein IIB63_04455 [Proteobacteria bacterium]|nr:hypothetical protein [Pseudomonadota bacterium]
MGLSVTRHHPVYNPRRSLSLPRSRPIPDPAAFSRRLASMMEKGLVA